MQTLNRHFAALTRAAFERHGFAGSQLASQWPAIVGAELASLAKPGQIKWPRSAKAAKTQGQGLGGTLVLHAQAGRGLEVHYATPQIIERVNQFLGYGAIAAVKVVQTSDQLPPPKPAKRPVSAAAKAAWDQALARVQDGELKLALARLASEISPKGPPLNPFSTGENTGFDQPETSSRTHP